MRSPDRRLAGGHGGTSASAPQREVPFVGAAVVAACSVGAVGVGLSGSAEPQNAGHLVILVACTMAVAACLGAARRGGSDARAWTLLGVAVAVWTAAQVFRTVYGFLPRHGHPIPFVADLAHLGFAVLAAAGLLSFRRPTWPMDRRDLFDGLVIATSLLFVSWSVVIGRITPAGSVGGWDRLVALAYPLVDTSIAALVVVLAMRRAPGDRRPWLLLSGGLLVLAVTDTVYVTLTVGGQTGPTGSQLATGWVGAFALIGLAALTPSRTMPTERRLRRVYALQELLPYVPVIGVLVTSAFSQVLDDPVLTGLGAAVLVLIAARHVVVTTDNVGLRHHLEDRVETRTAELTAARGDLQHAFETSPIGMAWADPDGLFIEVNPAFCDMVGRCREQLVGTAVTAITVSADGAATRQIPDGGHPFDRVEMRYRHADGSEVWAQGTVSIIRDATGAPRASVTQMQDVTARRAAEAALIRQALHDPLTELANRALLIDRLEQALARQARHADPLALLLLDLDGFKLVNDSLGHEAGDDVLRTLASRLTAGLRSYDTIARLGGDEFAVVLENTSPAQARLIAEQILAVVRTPVRTHGHSINPDASVGIATSTSDVDTPQTLLRNADLAMYAAKDSGKGTITVFTASMHETMMRQLTMDSELREAIDGEQFVLAYQPIVSLVTGRLEGFEALIRWHHPVRGVVLPHVFIPVAETAGLIVAMGRWVLREACRQAATWSRDHPGGDELTMSVNLSVRQLHDPQIVDTVVAALADAGLPAARLQLEITEGALDHRQSTTILDRLHATGVRLALDDFGTGYSSLSRLHTLPIDRVKIDKSFVDVLESGCPAPVVAATIAMAHSLGLQTVAEGVETVEQLPFLQLHHCDDVQGYLFGRPVSATATDALLRLRGTGTSWTDHARIERPATRPL